ncbi:hypothetical protein BJ742DRAFT_412558 [Cladochytrium replicatum]|nr:hypothetical protein BJ742DRAFT_412558 [Cladochytrium replicatum]
MLVAQTARQLNLRFGLRMYHHTFSPETILQGMLKYEVALGICKTGDNKMIGFVEGTTTKMRANK